MTMTSRVRCYAELRTFATYEERYKYLRVSSQVGVATFGFERHLNQGFYTSTQWRHVRNIVIARDSGCDMGVDGYEIYDRVIIHHMNPMKVQDILEGDERTLDPEYLICVTLRTHNAIHYGDENNLIKPLVARRPGDTKLW